MARRRKRRGVFPVFMLAIGLAAGWWFARYGAPMLKDVKRPVTSAAASGDIRKVDFRNFNYPALCAQESGLDGDIPVQGGEYTREDATDYFYFGVIAVSYGDVTGDGQAEAVVAASCNTGGTGQFSEGMLFSMRGSKPALIARVQGGDRAYGGIAGLAIKDKQVVVERYATDEGGPSCCPKYIETTRLRWDGKRLVDSGAVTRRVAPES